MLEIIKTQQRRLAPRLEGLAHWKVPAQTRRELRRFVQELALGKVNPGRKISEARQSKYLDLLKVPLEFLAKPTPRFTPKDIERFEQALTTDRIRSRLKQAPYRDSTKVDLRKALKIYLRWRLGAARAVRLAGWLDTRDRFKTPEFLREQEVEQLLEKCRTAEQRYIVALLFDSGARAEEFINIRREDVELPEGNHNFVRLTLREEFSKTKGRTISLYWRHTTSAVLSYFKQRLAQGLKAGDPVFASTYDAMRMFLRRLGAQVLSRPVHPHLFRHSSATYYADKMNRQQLCIRYGWKFSSNMPDIYISRAGMETKQLDEQFTQTELSTLKDDLARVNQDNQIKAQRIDQLQHSLEAMQRNVDLISAVLARNPSLHEVEQALAQKRRAPERKS